MRRMRWKADGGGWELDAEAPVTMEGTARAVPGDSLPLGLSRGSRLSRSKQLDFLHRFMAFPLVPSFSGDPANGGLLLHRAHTIHLRENWYVTLLEQFKIQRFVLWLQETASDHIQNTSLPKAIAGKIINFFSLGFGTELLITPESSLLLEMYNVKEGSRAKAVFLQKFHRHNLMLEAACPGLYLDKQGKYWDVPLSIAVDLASVTYGSGLNYHVFLQHNSGQPKHIFGDQTFEPPMPLLPGLCAKAAMSIKKHVNFWRGKEGKLKLVQPYDLFLSNPHISGVGILGAVASASFGENSARFSIKEGLICHIPSSGLCFRKNHFALFSDLFASITFKTQVGNFQRLFLDLTKFDAQLDFPSVSTFLCGATTIAKNLCYSQKPDTTAVRAICPNLRVSLQQQIIGPFSFRFESGIVLDSKDCNKLGQLEDTVYAIDWALKVLGSAKASFWYSPSRQEGMVELRFFEQ